MGYLLDASAVYPLVLKFPESISVEKLLSELISSS